MDEVRQIVGQLSKEKAELAIREIEIGQLKGEVEDLKKKASDKSGGSAVAAPTKNRSGMEAEDLELENAELEDANQRLERKLKDLTARLASAEAGKILVENLEDHKNFANLISNQGNLVEQLKNEKRRAAEL